MLRRRRMRLLLLVFATLCCLCTAFDLGSFTDVLCDLGFGCDHEKGCTQEEALNFDSLASIDDYSCIIVGCMSPVSSTYNPEVPLQVKDCHHFPGCYARSDRHA